MDSIKCSSGEESGANHVSSSAKSRANLLVLIDGHAILHRAYHALPPLTTSKGELVNAVFGFCLMLLKIRDELAPTYFAVSFDLPKPTFRNKLFANYQIQRPKMANELVEQVEKVKKVVKVLGIPIYEKEGYEADDVIGTLARQASGEIKKLRNLEIKGKNKNKPLNISISQYPNIEVVIVTGDRDLLQLVNERTKVYMLIRGLTEATLFDQAKVEEKYGLKPRQIPDYKALIGDPSDNYPGVSGIGPKTAVQLVSKYGTVEKLYGEIKKLRNEVIKGRLLRGRGDAEMSKRLATIVTNVPVELNLEKCRVETFNTPQVRKLFAELEFKSLIPRLQGGQQVIQEEKKSDKQMKLF